MFLSQPDTCPVDIKGKRRQAYSGGRDTYVRLFVSNNAGVDFDEVCIPQQLRDDDFTVLRSITRPNSTFLMVDEHTRTGNTIRTLYSPGQLSHVYSVALRNSEDFGMGAGWVDITAVEGLPGVYIGNQK